MYCNGSKRTVKVERIKALGMTCTEGTPDRNADVLSCRIASIGGRKVQSRVSRLPPACLFTVGQPWHWCFDWMFQYTMHAVYNCMNEETGYTGFALSTVSYTGTGAGVCVLEVG